MKKEVKMSDYYLYHLREQKLIFELMRKDKQYTNEDIEMMRQRIEAIKSEYRKALMEEMEKEKGRAV